MNNLQLVPPPPYAAASNDDDDEPRANSLQTLFAPARVLTRDEILDARVALEDTGYLNPFEQAIVGAPWDMLELTAFGDYTYGAVRATVEQTYVRVGSSTRASYAEFVTHPDGTLEARRLSMKQLRDALGAKTYLGRLKAEDSKLKPTGFLRAWLQDESARTLREVVFNPSLPPALDAATQVFNNWPGLAATRQHPQPLTSADDIAFGMRAINVFVSHVHQVLVGGVAAHADWVLDYFARIVQRPHEPSTVAVLFSSLPGAGKNALLDFFRLRVLGERVTCQLDDPSTTLFSKFATEHADRIFMQWDEVANLGDLRERIKNLITSYTLIVRQKYCDDRAVTNYLNLCITTNATLDAIALDSRDRRFALFRAAPAHLGDVAYFNMLHATFADSRAARAVYDMLMARRPPQTPGDMQASRPVTDYYQLCIYQNIPPLARFLSAVINSRAYSIQAQGNPAVRVGDMYHDYVHFFNDTKASYGPAGTHVKPFSLPRFTSEIQVYCSDMDAAGGDGMLRRRFDGGYAYVIATERLHGTLVRFGAYDPQAGFLARPPGPSAWVAQEKAKQSRKRKAADAAAAAAAADAAADAAAAADAD